MPLVSKDSSSKAHLFETEICRWTCIRPYLSCALKKLFVNVEWLIFHCGVEECLHLSLLL